MGIRAGGAKPRKDFRTLTNLYMNGQLKLDEMISNTAGLDGSSVHSTPCGRHRGPHGPPAPRLRSTTLA